MSVLPVPPSSVPSDEELLALPYENSPFDVGLTGEDFRAQLHAYGDHVRHWMAFPKAPEDAVGPRGERPERDGTLYIENVLGETVRALIYETERNVFDVELGLLEQGHAAIACMPDEIEPARGDRFVLLDKLVVMRVALTNSGEQSVSLGRRFVSEIVQVFADGQLLPASAYSLQSDEENVASIQWTGEPPSCALVTAHFFPSYVYLDVSDRNPPKGTDGERLPIRGILTMEKR